MASLDATKWNRLDTLLTNYDDGLVVLPHDSAVAVIAEVRERDINEYFVLALSNPKCALHIQRLFKCFQTLDLILVDTMIELGSFEVMMNTVLQHGLETGQYQILTTVLRELTGCHMFDNTNLMFRVFPSCCQSIRGDVESSQLAVSLCSKILDCRQEPEKFLQCLMKVESECIRDTTVHLRYLALYSQWCTTQQGFALCLQQGIVQTVVNSCTIDDCLVQILAIELLRNISTTLDGLQHLLDTGVLAWLLSTCSGINDDDSRFDLSLGQQAMREFGTILTMPRQESVQGANVAWWEHNSGLVLRYIVLCQEFMDNSSELSRLCGIHCISDYLCVHGSSPIVASKEMENTVNSWLSLQNTSNIEVQAAVLNGLAAVLDATWQLQQETLKTGRSAHIARVMYAKTYFDTLGTCNRRQLMSTEHCLKLARQPIEQTKHASLNLLRSVGQMSWGLQSLFNTPGFREYIEDPSTEYNRDGRLWKFGVIEAICANSACSALNDVLMDKLRVIAARGPHAMFVQVAEPLTLDR